MRRKRRKINIKRFLISLTVLIILPILTTKISLMYAAKNLSTGGNTLTEDSLVLEEMKKEVPKESIQEEELSLQEIKKKTENPKKSEELEDNLEVDNKSNKEERDEAPIKSTKKMSKYNEYFKDDLFIGDSITDSLSFYELIDKENVIAELGFTTKKAQGEIEKIVNKNPTNIYMMLGMNDILTYRDTEKFIKHYEELIDKLHESLPDTSIYVQSILPVSSEVKKKKPLLTNENVNIFNQSLLDMVEKKDLKYLNIRNIVEDNMDLLEPDGIHVKYKFYELWLEYLIDNTK